MHLHKLKYFISVVETGSVTKVAEQCFISQPSLSPQLAKLEKSIGKKLFLRVKGKLILTDPGLNIVCSGTQDPEQSGRCSTQG